MTRLLIVIAAALGTLLPVPPQKTALPTGSDVPPSAAGTFSAEASAHVGNFLLTITPQDEATPQYRLNAGWKAVDIDLAAFAAQCKPGQHIDWFHELGHLKVGCFTEVERPTKHEEDTPKDCGPRGTSVEITVLTDGSK